MKKFLCLLLCVFSSMLAISCSSGTTITLNLNGGSIEGATEFNVQLGDELNINDPVRDGYTFGGWLYIGEVVDLSSWSIDMKNVTLTAKWIASISNIYFDSDGGSEVLPITQEFESIVYEPVTPKKTGYTFLGWYEEGSDVPYKFNKMEKGDVYLKARWEITKFTIKFYTGGGSEVEEITLNYGEPVLKPQDPVREGYVFEGWYELNGKEEYVFDTIEDRDVYLVARWSSKTSKIKLNLFGGFVVVNGSNRQEYETTIVAGKILTLPVPKKEGFIFTGFEYNGELFKNNSAWKSDEPIAEINATYKPGTLTYYLDTNGGIPENSIGKINYGDSTTAIKSIVPVKEGYNFDCWTYNGLEIGEEFTYLPLENNSRVVIVAKYTPKTVKLTLEATSNELDSEIAREYQVLYNQKITLPVPNAEQGLTFKGWKIKGTDLIVSSILGEHVCGTLGDKILVPCYDETPFISFCHYDGSVDIVYISDEMEIPTPKKMEGYSVVWNLNEYEIFELETTTSVYAEVKANTYIVTYRDSRIYLKRAEYVYGTPVELYNYKKSGYVLKGWSLTEGDTENLINGTVVWDITSHVTLYAVYEPAPFKITYDTSNVEVDFELVDEFGNVKEPTQEVLAGSNYTLYTLKTKNDVVSVIWQYKGKDEPNSGVWDKTTDIVLTAKVCINTNRKIILNIDTNCQNGVVKGSVKLGSKLRTITPRVTPPKQMKLIGFNYKSKFFSVDDTFNDYNYDGSYLIAVYIPVVTVHIDLNGGTGVSTTKIDYMGKVSTMERKPTAPQNQKLVGFLYHGKLYKLNDIWDVENYDGSKLTAVYESDEDSWSPIV